MKNKKGFTLIEMLIIMIIISILTVIGKVSYDSHAEKTRFTEAYTNVASSYWHNKCSKRFLCGKP